MLAARRGYGPPGFSRRHSSALLIGHPAFSEDLDFALERPGAGYKFRDFLTDIRDEFVKEGYLLEIKANDQKNR